MPHTIIFPVMLPSCWAQYTAGADIAHTALSWAGTLAFLWSLRVLSPFCSISASFGCYLTSLLPSPLTLFPAASVLPLHKPFTLRWSFHISLPCPLQMPKTKFGRVSLALATSLHILSWYLSCTSSHLPRCNLCIIPCGCLSFSIALEWLSCKGMQ